MSFAAARDAVTDVFAAVDAAVYDYVPPMVAGPSIFVFPNDPYVEFRTPGLARVLLNLRLTALVPYIDGQAALENLETLMIDILSVIPSGWQIGPMSAPSITAVGPSNCLVSEMTVTVATALGD